MMEQPIWFKYAIYDENGVCGVRNDAQDDVKKAYAAYVQEQEKARMFKLHRAVQFRVLPEWACRDNLSVKPHKIRIYKVLEVLEMVLLPP